MKPRFFRSAAAFRVWLAKNHDTAKDLLLSFNTVGSAKGGITYAQALDEALCYGWIDGVRRSLDETSYSIRFAPRKPNSIWSQVNIGHVARLTEAGLMQPFGLASFERRGPAKSEYYSYEARRRGLDADLRCVFKTNAKAWAFFEEQPTGYQHTASWWVTSVKRDESRQKRLATLIELSASSRRLPMLTSPYARAEDKAPLR